MKDVLLILAAGLLFACNNTDKKATAGETAEKNASATAPATPVNDSANFTEIQWIDSTFQDLGRLEEGQVADIVWRFRNTGNKPLVVGDVVPGCGCTVADKPQEPIAPGGEGVIRAKFDSKGQSMGTHRKAVTAMVNTRQPSQSLVFQVNVIKN